MYTLDIVLPHFEMVLLVEDERTGGFTFTWNIHNFNYCVQKDSEYIASPKFVVKSMKDTTFYLRLYPRGASDAPGFISYFLGRDIKSDIVTSFYYALSIRDCNGLLKKRDGSVFSESEPSKGFPKFLSLNELNEPGSYLENGTLTLGCRIWKDDQDLISASVKCYAHSKIKVTKIDCMWTLNDFENNSNLTTEIQTSSTEIPYFTIQLLKGVTFGDDTIHFAVKQPQGIDKFILFCTIHLLDADGKIAHSVKGEHLFHNPNEKQIWNLPFLSRRKLLSHKELYFPSGRITLRCQFSASTGDVNNEIESFENGITEDIQLKCSSHKRLPDLSNLWAENMQQFYKDGKFSNVTVRSLNGQYPVHKAILCAQSEVFSAMFERDMKESRTGVVEIEDLEDDTISKMLMFLYTNILEDLDCSLACKLYFAADKYQITALQRKCSNYLLVCVDISNVCDILALADTHQDEKLKSIAQDFIFDHYQEIIISEDWKKLMVANSHLTSETMQLMICKKFLSNLKP